MFTKLDQSQVFSSGLLENTADSSSTPKQIFLSHKVTIVETPPDLSLPDPNEATDQSHLIHLKNALQTKWGQTDERPPDRPTEKRCKDA
jgi:hypothetical protein